MVVRGTTGPPNGRPPAPGLLPLSSAAGRRILDAHIISFVFLPRTLDLKGEGFSIPTGQQERGMETETWDVIL